MIRKSYYLLTGEQIRAARALARIDQAGLASRCGLSLETVRRLERTRGPVEASARTLSDIVEVFRGAGIEFDVSEDGVFGVRARPPGDVSPALPEQASASRRVGQLHRLIYFSTATAPLDEVDAVLMDISAAALVRNVVRDVTGVLLFCDGRFVQVLEGEKSAVIQLYGLISTDQRHCDMTVIESSDVHARQFPRPPLWVCRLDESDELITKPLRGPGGFRPEVLSPVHAMQLFVALSERNASRSVTGRRLSGALRDSYTDYARPN